MNDTLDAPAILTSQQIKIPADDKQGRANEVSAVKKFFMPIAHVLGNIVRFAAGPPMSEREHGNPRSGLGHSTALPASCVGPTRLFLF